MADCILGVDPGLTGAMALVHRNGILLEVRDMPVAGKDIDPAGLARYIGAQGPLVAIIERVGAMPGQGVSSTFKFGTGYGMVQGVIAALGIEVHFVSPAAWKRHFRLLNTDKDTARAKAIQLWPKCRDFSRKKDIGRADAALIARFWAETAPHPSSRLLVPAPVQPTIS